MAEIHALPQSGPEVFAPGHTVTLKSGGPLMTVVAAPIDADQAGSYIINGQQLPTQPGLVTCAWFIAGSGILNIAQFPALSLKRDSN